ncbi:uncharacterized protein LOC144135129 [Amblyomma americanum]
MAGAVPAILFVSLAFMCRLKPSSAACDAGGGRLHDAAKALVANFPSEHYSDLNRESDWFPGVTLTRVKLSGLHECEILGPVQGYCRESEEMAQVELHCASLSATVGWSMCSGRNGTLISELRYARLSLEFFAEGSEGEGSVKLRSAGTVAPSAVTGATLQLTGTSEFLNRTASTVAATFSETLREFWLVTLPGHVLEVLHSKKRQ